MKNFFIGLAVVLGIIAAALCFTGHFKLNTLDEAVNTRLDSTAVLKAIDAKLVPTFTSADDIVDFRQDILEQKKCDSIFLKMPDKTLFNVASVLIKKNGSCTKKDVVQEFREHSDIYNNLPPEADLPVQVVTAPTSQDTARHVIGETTSSRDTMIEGKKIRITTTTTSYE